MIGFFFLILPKEVSAKTINSSISGVDKPGITFESNKNEETQELIRKDLKVNSINVTPSLLLPKDIDFSNWQTESIVKWNGIAQMENESYELSEEEQKDNGGYQYRVGLKTEISLITRNDTIPRYQTRYVGYGFQLRDPTTVTYDIADYQLLKDGTFKVNGNFVNLPSESNNGIYEMHKWPDMNKYQQNNRDAYYSVLGYHNPNNDDNILSSDLDISDGGSIGIEYFFLRKVIQPNPQGSDIFMLSSVRFLFPQLVKSIYRDIDNPNGSDLAPSEKTGYNTKMDDTIETSAKDISDYVFDHYEIVEENASSVPTSTDKKWTGKMTDKKRAIVFYYKKKTPDISLTKKAGKKEYYLGETASYTLQMKNIGTGELTDAKLTDKLPEGMSKPNNIKLDGQVINEGTNNSNSLGQYFEWEESKRELYVYSTKLAADSLMTLTYDSKIESGLVGQEKINHAKLQGSNIGDEPIADELIKIIDKKILLHIRQEVLDTNENIVVPETATICLNNLNKEDANDVLGRITMIVPSYLVDSNKSYKSVGLLWNPNYPIFLPSLTIPEFYSYAGYQLTSTNALHNSENRNNDSIEELNYLNNSEYWLTVYIRPSITPDGPPFYNWDYKENDFGKIKS